MSRITVKPLLTLDYFLTRDVVADDPMTPAIEPFTAGTSSCRKERLVKRQTSIHERNPSARCRGASRHCCRQRS